VLIEIAQAHKVALSPVEVTFRLPCVRLGLDEFGRLDTCQRSAFADPLIYIDEQVAHDAGERREYPDGRRFIPNQPNPPG